MISQRDSRRNRHPLHPSIQCPSPTTSQRDTLHLRHLFLTVNLTVQVRGGKNTQLLPFQLKHWTLQLFMYQQLPPVRWPPWSRQRRRRLHLHRLRRCPRQRRKLRRNNRRQLPLRPNRKDKRHRQQLNQR